LTEDQASNDLKKIVAFYKRPDIPVAVVQI